MKRTCVVCGKEFEITRIDQRHCSRACAIKYNATQYKHTCKECGNVVYNQYSNNRGYGCRCGGEYEHYKMTHENRIQLFEDNLVKQQFMHKYNADTQSETLTDINNIDIEVAREYLNNNNTDNIPSDDILKLQAKISNLETTLTEVNNKLSFVTSILTKVFNYGTMNTEKVSNNSGRYSSNIERYSSNIERYNRERCTPVHW